MSILVGKESRVLCQGLGRAGIFHTSQCIAYGTNVVGGIKPGKGGTKIAIDAGDGKQYDDLPVFNTVADAVREVQPNVSMIYVPAPGAADAIMEAADAGVHLIICITEGIPTLDMAHAAEYVRKRGCRLIGPNCPGIITPGACKIGIMPGYIHNPGTIGVISRSGTLTYEAVWQLTNEGLGQSTCIGIGGDPIIGSNFVDLLKDFNEDPNTEGVIMIGEIGGDGEEKGAQYIKENFKKPVVGFIAGRTAPPGKRMGHAGAIISGGKGTAAEKVKCMEECGIKVAPSPAEIGITMKNLLAK